MVNPIAAIIKKETLKLEIPATNPIKGGPMRKPKKPMVETAVIAIPTSSFFDFPAALYTSGTTDDTPKPTSEKPIMPAIKTGKAVAIINPIQIRQPLTCKVLFKPKR